jgi:hypothetical protein
MLNPESIISTTNVLELSLHPQFLDKVHYCFGESLSELHGEKPCLDPEDFEVDHCLDKINELILKNELPDTCLPKRTFLSTEI